MSDDINKSESTREKSKLEAVTASPGDVVEFDESNSDNEVERCDKSKRTNRQRFNDYVL